MTTPATTPAGGELVPFAQGTAVQALGNALSDPDLIQYEEMSESDRALMQLAELDAAETAEELLGKRESTSAGDIIGVPMILSGGVTLRKSTLEDKKGTGVFVIVRATRADTGEPLVFTAGSSKILGQLAKLLDLGRIGGTDPLAVRVCELGAARKGQSAPLGLELVP